MKTRRAELETRKDEEQIERMLDLFRAKRDKLRLKELMEIGRR